MGGAEADVQAFVQEQRDRQEIADLFLAYAEHVDLFEIDELVDLFTEDAVLDFGHGRLFTGHDRLRVLLRDRMAQYENTSHHISNIRVRLTGADTATANVYVYAWHRRPGSPASGDEDMHIWGRYFDDIVRTPAGWRIAYHRIRAAGEAGAPAPFERIPRRAPGPPA